MSPVDLSFLVLTCCNTLRILAFVPQVPQAARCGNGTKSVSLLSWSLFLASHLSGAVYALVNARDWTLAWVFLGNAAGCAVILVVAGARRIAHARQRLWRAAGRAQAIPAAA